MATEKGSREAALEWEPAATPIVFQGLDFPTPLIPGVNKLTISRDQEMALSLLAEGRMANRDDVAKLEAQERQRPAGAFLDMSELEFDAGGTGKHSIEPCPRRRRRR
jgi:hypothetical protein